MQRGVTEFDEILQLCCCFTVATKIIVGNNIYVELASGGDGDSNSITDTAVRCSALSLYFLSFKIYYIIKLQ